MKGKRPVDKIPLRQEILIYCCGKEYTELDYFTAMKLDRYRNTQIKVKPKFPAKQGYKKVFTEVKTVLKESNEVSPQYPPPKSIFIVTDIDDIYNKGKHQDYKERKENLLKEAGRRQVIFIESHPCFELWFLLHFEFTDKPYIYCDELIKDLRKYLKGYSKKEKYRKKVYDMTKQMIAKAIEHAKRIREKKRVAGEAFSYTDVYKLIEKIDSV